MTNTNIFDNIVKLFSACQVIDFVIIRPEVELSLTSEEKESLGIMVKILVQDIPETVYVLDIDGKEYKLVESDIDTFQEKYYLDKAKTCQKEYKDFTWAGCQDLAEFSKNQSLDALKSLEELLDERSKPTV